MNDIERLLDSTIPFLEDLLKKYGEFFPVASAVKTDGSIAQVGTYDGDEKPLSDKLIKDFKTAFKAQRDDYRSVMIFYDVRVVNPSQNKRWMRLPYWWKQNMITKHIHFIFRIH